MTEAGDSVARFYADWPRYNERVAAHLRGLSATDLALRAHGGHWPIWAIAGHTVGARIYWLCHVFGEPGAETTPFTDPSGLGWEDELDVVRTADEVADAWESTWRVVQGCLDRWTPDSLGQVTRRTGSRGIEVHSRQSILLRMITHEAYHGGEIALIEGIHGRPQLDLWPASDWLVEPG
ncbi:MAG: DinB family protein [Chloroflexota bacterium]|nr:MAG: DinB family protein [Chloroflexota bacterium]